MLTPDQVDAILRLGPAGLLLLALVATYLGMVRVGRQVDKDVEERKARETKLEKERDLAYARLDRLADVLETLLQVKVE